MKATDMVKNENMKKNTGSIFSPFDLQMGKFLSSITLENREDIQLAAALISRQLRDGHVCVNLPEFAGRTLAAGDDQNEKVQFPELSIWLQSLKTAECVGLPGDFKPMILDDARRLYFQRYWQYEQNIAAFILRRLPVQQDLGASQQIIREKLQFYFPEMSFGKISGSDLAAVTALLRKFLVIAGSPGTGKTTTITKIMAFLLDVKRSVLRIALCAPTGKAAARLEEAVKKTKKILNAPADVQNKIPDEAMTIHRLLRSIKYSPYFHFNEKNYLPYDMVVVDEASMVDLPLAAKLMTALSPSAQLILLGDKDQLASVEAGAVLGSICFPDPLNIFSKSFGRHLEEICGEKPETSGAAPGIQDCIIELKHNYRFSEESGIGLLSRAINGGDTKRVLELIDMEKFSDIHFSEISRPEEIPQLLRDRVLKSYREYLYTATSAPVCTEDVFDRFEAFRVLCAMRVGIWGSQRMNAVIERLLSESGLINLTTPYYEGRPVMIVQNDYRLRLFNGDVGIILRDPADKNNFKTFFRDQRQGVRSIAPERLPPHETVWAMTVHKSQGSEFDKVALILSDSDAPVLTRELLYTGITRARLYVDIWTTRDVLTKTVQKQIIRQSGLTDAIRYQRIISPK
jgi:exodeoxyribonuclease V alpha subunit